jgi:hypothetical protein
MPGKDVGLRIRVERNLRDLFLDTCRSQDKPAAQVLREFMRNYVANNGSGGPAETARKGRRQNRRET